MITEGPMNYGLRVNTVIADKTAVIKPDVGTPRGVDFFRLIASSAGHGSKLWLDAIEQNDQKVLIVQPEQAFTVTRILDAIYKSSASGQLITF